MKNLLLEDHGTAALLRLHHGVTNAIGGEVLEDLKSGLMEAKRRYRGLVLAGNPKFFSIGLDLPQLLMLDRRGMEAFWNRYEDSVLELYSLPLPTACAITGHANGGGAILALACDFRFIAGGRKLISLNEVKIGLPVPYLADMMLRQIAGDRTAVRLEYLSEFVMPEDARAAGLVDEICPAAEVEDRALARIKAITALPPFGFPLTKMHRVKDIRARFLADRKDVNAAFLDCWFSPPVQELLKEACQKF